jgi:hypothetical protein
MDAVDEQRSDHPDLGAAKGVLAVVRVRGLVTIVNDEPAPD